MSKQEIPKLIQQIIEKKQASKEPDQQHIFSNQSLGYNYEHRSPYNPAYTKSRLIREKMNFSETSYNFYSN